MSAGLPAAILVATLAAVLALGDAPTAIRLPLGIVATLLLPGYALSAIAFPRCGSLTVVERIALSIGLSLAVIAFGALALDRSVWGLREQPLIVSMTGWTLVTTSIALWQRSRVPPAERFRLLRPVQWRRLEQPAQHAVMGLGAASLLSAVALGIVVCAPPPAATEFFVLGSDGRPANYPRQAHAGVPITLTLGITNLERRDVDYRIVALDGDAPAASHGPVTVTVRAGATREIPLSLQLTSVGKDREVVLLLYVGEAARPYRSLRLWIDVVP